MYIPIGDPLNARDKYYVIIEDKGLFPPVTPPSGVTVNMEAILDKLALDSKAEREAHAKALQDASELAKKATEAQTAALIKLKPAGIKLSYRKFDGRKDRYQYMQWKAQFTDMIKVSSVDDDK